MPLPDTEALLSADHDALGRLLETAIELARSGHREGTFEAVDWFWARLAMHIRAEHLHLFPAVLAVSSDPPGQRLTSDTIVKLREDHDLFMRTLGAMVKVLRTDMGTSISQIADDLEGLRLRLERHDRIEEDHIYPLAGSIRPLQPESLASAITRELANVPPRFRKRDRASMD